MGVVLPKLRLITSHVFEHKRLFFKIIFGSSRSIIFIVWKRAAWTFCLISLFVLHVRKKAIKFEMSHRCVNDNWIVIFGWTIPLIVPFYCGFVTGYIYKIALRMILWLQKATLRHSAGVLLVNHHTDTFAKSSIWSQSLEASPSSALVQPCPPLAEKRRASSPSGQATHCE